MRIANPQKRILDSVTQKVSRLQSRLDPSDRARLTEHLDDVREIERRIQKAERQSANEGNVPEAPVGVPELFEDHLKLMFDLQTLAYRAEIRRIITLMYARDTSGATYTNSGNRDGFHGASHHSNARAKMDAFALINRYHVQMLAYFMKNTSNHFSDEQVREFVFKRIDEDQDSKCPYCGTRISVQAQNADCHHHVFAVTCQRCEINQPYHAS